MKATAAAAAAPDFHRIFIILHLFCVNLVKHVIQKQKVWSYPAYFRTYPLLGCRTGFDENGVHLHLRTMKSSPAPSIQPRRRRSLLYALCYSDESFLAHNP